MDGVVSCVCPRSMLCCASSTRVCVRSLFPYPPLPDVPSRCVRRVSQVTHCARTTVLATDPIHAGLEKDEGWRPAAVGAT